MTFLLRLILRRFRFGLGRMLILVAMISTTCSWQKHWIQERRDFLQRDGVLDYTEAYATAPVTRPVAPSLLAVFGERGVKVLGVKETNAKDFEDAKRLFPEAEVVRYAFASGGLYSR